MPQTQKNFAMRLFTQFKRFMHWLPRCVFGLWACSLAAQPLTFQKQLDSLNGVFCVEQTEDGTFWIGTFLGKIIRLDEKGNWRSGHRLRKGDTTSVRFIYDLQKKAGGGVWALYDRNNQNNALDDFLILANLDANGLPIWQKPVHFGEVNHWAHNRLCADNQGNAYVLSARFAPSGSSEPSRIVLVKVAPDGTLLWAKGFYNPARNFPRSITLLQDGSLLISGNSLSGSLSGFLLRVSPDGDVLWSRRYANFLFKAALEMPDGTWCLAATEFGQLPQKACVMRLDQNGNVLWANRLEMAYALNWIPNLVLLPNADIAVLNYETAKATPAPDVIALSPAGQFLWAKRYDICHNFGAAAGLVALDGGLSMIRQRGEGPLFLKTDLLGQCSTCSSESVSLKLTPVSDVPLPYDWQSDVRLPIIAAEVDFTPITLNISDFCGDKKPLTGISLSPNPLCAGGNLLASALETQTADTYNWFFPNGKPQHQSGSAVAFGIQYEKPVKDSVRLIAEYGFCRDTFYRSLIVNASPKPIDLGKDTLICGAKQGLMLDADVDGAAKWLWNDGSQDSVRLIQKSGTYIVKALNGSCESTDTLKVQFMEGFSLDLPSELTVCGTDTIWLDASVQGADSYLWSDGVSTARRAVTKPGFYAVNAILGNCNAADITTVSPFPAPPDLPSDTLICRDQALVLSAGNSIAGEIFWNGKKGFATYEVREAGKVHRAVSFQNCYFSDTINVLVADCQNGIAYYAPNAFSPDGSPENQVFSLNGVGLEVLDLNIYDRWGNHVFHQKNEAAARGWDGTFGGKTTHPGVYVWVARVRQNGREAVLRGDVVLLR